MAAVREVFSLIPRDPQRCDPLSDILAKEKFLEEKQDILPELERRNETLLANDSVVIFAGQFIH